MNARILFIIILTFVFSGCQLTTKIPKSVDSDKTFDLRNEIYQSKPCCTVLNALKKSIMKDSLAVSMEENTDLVQIDSVKSPYLLIELEDQASVQYYSVKSFYLEHKFAFIPMVSVLDSNFNIVKQTDLNYMRYKHQDLVYDDSHFWMYFSVDKKATPNVKYLLVHSAKPIGSKVSISSDSHGGTQMAMAGNQPVVYHQRSTAFKVNPVVSPSGAVVITKLSTWSKPINDWVIQPL
ncbi:hypothetical protein J7384_18365 [Endozoicomonas sp. G2_1]|uniref:MalM family protein n=1 Tax=Endozoicomonas sp. G2_1 TaxID=2821091 RepID=UPI001AD974C6|nr:MalM family protein [Endozoicomonas sp. G2_1]MBO9492332.1 hypothetical protein [Endozoicomonas sp. G2_1]